MFVSGYWGIECYRQLGDGKQQTRDLGHGRWSEVVAVVEDQPARGLSAMT
jgi:hypothetical protein